MTTSDCPWASIVPRHKDHEDSESACYARNTVAIRSHFRPRVSTIEEAYDESGHLRSEFLETDFERVILPRYHRRAAEAALMGMNGRVTLTSGLRQAMRAPLTYNQLAHRHPWAVIVVRRGRRYRKLCANIATAVHTAALLEKKYGNATVVSRSRGYVIPPKLRGKLPKGWMWCPYCMKPRKFKRAANGETFYGLRKVWSDEKQRYIFRERKLALLECPVCSSTNRDTNFRRSNQPWEVRRVKRGARKIKARHKTKRRGNKIEVVV